MVRRHAASSFGAAYAFPGGVVDTADGEVQQYCTGRSALDADQVLSLATGGLDYYVAAIRELFEETGVLLATVDNSAEALEEMRYRLNHGSKSWTEFLSDSNAHLLCNQLHYFSHWITPEHLPKRYTTRFFVAELPAGQFAYHDERELTNSTWITAADALQAGKNGAMKLHFPTRTILQSLAAHDRVSAMVDWARRCEANGVETIRPVMPDATQ